jgi:hypothetical protein
MQMQRVIRLFGLVLAAALAAPAWATVSTTTSTASYTCNGSTTAFPVPFPFFAAGDLVVTNTPTGAGTITLHSGSDFTVTGGNGSTGTLTTVSGYSPCANGNTLTVSRNVLLTQPTPFSTQGAFSPKAHEKAFDRLMMGLQQVDRRVAAEEATRAVAVAAAINPTPTTVNSNASVLATSSTTARTLAAIAADDVNARGFAIFAQAVALANSSGGTLVIRDATTITTALETISAPVRFEGAGRLNLNTGGSVALAGPLTAPLSQIFDTSGGGTLTFTAKVVQVVPQWWGAHPIGEPGYSTFDSTSAIQSAINAGAVAGRVVVSLSPGTYKTTSPLILRSGLSLVGAGRYTSTITNSTGSVFTWTGLVTGLRIEGLGVTASAGHIFNQGSDKIARSRISEFLFTQNSPNYSIWFADAQAAGEAGIYIDMLVESGELISAANATVSPWRLVNGYGSHNSNTWRRLVVTGRFASVPFFEVSNISPGTYAYDLTFEDITGEQCTGGIISAETVQGLHVRNVHDYDATTYTAPLFRVATNATSGLRSRFVQIVNSGRRGGALGAGVFDASIDAAYTTLIGVGPSSGNVSLYAPGAATIGMQAGAQPPQYIVGTAVAVPYSTSITADAGQGTIFTITPTDTVGFTINVANPQQIGQLITVMIKNQVGTLGAITYAATYFKITAPAAIANGTTSGQSFVWDGAFWRPTGAAAISPN